MREKSTWWELCVHSISGVSRIKFAAAGEKLLSKRFILDLYRREAFLFDGIISVGHEYLLGVGGGAVELGLVEGISTGLLDVTRLYIRIVPISNSRKKPKNWRVCLGSLVVF